MKRKIVSVSEVNQYVSRIISEDYMLSDLWISGEISNCKYHHTGHIYFTIKDERASISAVMFDRDARRLLFRLEEGLRIYARVRITIYEKTGTYQAYVYDIEKQGKGLLYERYERLKAKLEHEGLFDIQYKKPLPSYPKHVGVITSVTGAAVKDIIQVAGRRNASVPITIYNTYVQGEQAIEGIVSAIKLANKEKRVDVLIVGRGGGSIEDLWAFNEEAVARAIFASNIPVVSAVGHEVDFTIADFVSSRRAATPSAAAEMVIPSKDELIEGINRARRSLSLRFEERLTSNRNYLSALLSRPIFVNKDAFYKGKMQEVDQLSQALGAAYEKQVSAYAMRYQLAVEKLDKLSPLNTLKRGYGVIMRDKHLVSSVKQVEIESSIEVVLSDGTLKAVVKEKE